MNQNGVEVNFDGLVGPTHNYSGLSYGNIASTKNKRSAANPREAALQGLEKMKYIADLGLVQGVLPPQERPYIPLLRSLGYQGDDVTIWKKIAEESAPLLNICSSAAAMWAANAATVSPSFDSGDGKVHFTPANLTAKIHRSIEADATARILKTIFKDDRFFTHHDPLPYGLYFSDEGAANHSRLCRRHGENGVQLFVWGRSSLLNEGKEPAMFPARQTLEASQAIARNHQLDPTKVVFAQQNPAAIDAGVFHNDVIAVANEHVLMFHQEAFLDENACLDVLSRRFEEASKTPLIKIRVSSLRVPLCDAIATYLFNSQLVSLANGSMAIIAPKECADKENVFCLLNEIVADTANPINAIHFLNLHESMRNGGGPACLRLRVVLSQQELQAAHQGVFFTDTLYRRLKAWVLKHYRDRLLPADLNDPLLIEETRQALNELTSIMKLGPIYEFQR